MFYSSKNIEPTLVSSSVWKATSVGYIRCNWSNLEPSEGKYNWELIDNSIRICAEKGNTVALAVMPASINSDTSYSQATPLWVFDAGAKYTTENVNSQAVQIKIPVWNDSVYKAKLQNLITAIKNRYDNNRNIAYFDIRSYGNWGEWHLGNLPHSSPLSLTDQETLINMWKGFSKPIMLPTNSSGVNPTDAIKYATDSNISGIRRDGCLNPKNTTAALSLLYCYNKFPSTAEWRDSYSSMINSGTWNPLLFEETLVQGKPSYMGLSQWDENKFYSQQKTLVDRWLNRIGYWFKLTKVTYPRNLGNGSSSSISFTVKNDGTAPFYPNRSNKGYVKLALLDSSNNILCTTSLNRVNPYNWKPNQYNNESADFSFPYYAKASKIAFGVFSSNSLANPDVKLGNGAGLSNNWYILSNMSRDEPNAISNNKIYTSSSEFADPTFGFREARAAFDGNAATRWEANSKAAGEWLEVNLGASESFSSVYLKENAASITGFTIQYYNGTTWKTACKGTSIGIAGKTIKFATEAGTKVRIYITSCNANPNLDEFTVNKS
ncbi:discoidin domain-containing protein [Clostridium akagii]|uniref:discoidin domain-containing protein n=1 Tax=Clostridium akagii TaxID=91623 RepID=UPI0012EBE749|nr:discoidin domain-containing protein [Clostridium akagii]